MRLTARSDRALSKAETSANVVFRRQGIVASETVDEKAAGRPRIEPDRQRAILARVTRPWRENLASTDITAEDARNGAEVHGGASEVRLFRAGVSSSAPVCVAGDSRRPVHPPNVEPCIESRALVEHLVTDLEEGWAA